MERCEHSRFNTQIYEEACEWFVACRAGDLDEAARAALDHWLRKSPEHVSAYLEVAAIWNEGPSLDHAIKWDVDTLISDATHDPDNVVPWRVAPSGEVATRSDTGRPQYTANPADRRTRELEVVSSAAVRIRGGARWRLAIAASIAIITVFAPLIWLLFFSVPTYATGIGEQRSIQLDDGSSVELNSRSKLAVHFSKRERDVTLMEGQALFHVAKDAARPFVVATGDTTVRAVGTQFDVYQKDNGTIVTVIEGRVAILTDHPASDETSVVDVGAVHTLSASPALPAAARAQATSIFLSTGEQLTVTPKTVQRTEHANVDGATAWTEHRIVFEGASLADVAQEFNRYNKRQLVVDDPTLETFHISGVFSSTDPDSLIRFLRGRPGLRIIETAAEIRIGKNIS